MLVVLCTHSLAHSLIITAYPGRYASTIKAFQVEGGIGSTYIAEGKQVLGIIWMYYFVFSPTQSLTHSLEKKWISVVRLQKKVLELEAQVQLLQSQSKGVFDR